MLIPKRTRCQACYGWVMSLSLLMSSPVYSQDLSGYWKDLTGYWQGMEHDTNSVSRPSPTSLTLVQNGTILTGYFYQSAFFSDSINVTFAIENGQVHNQEGSFEIHTPIRQQGPPGWCTGELVFSYDATRQRLLMRATYRESSCAPSIVELYRPTLKARQPFCPSEPKDLYVFGFDTHWYADAQRQVFLYQGNAYQPQLESTTTFYITQMLYGSETPAVPVVIMVDPLEISSSATVVAQCPSGQGQVVVQANGRAPLRYRLDEGPYQASPVFELSQAGSYSLTVIDSLGCQLTQPVVLLNDCASAIYVPTAFSPNGDGLNDELIVWFGFSSVTLEEFAVFDRWGSLLYHNEQPRLLQSGQALWSGQTFAGPLLPGLYSYQLQVRTATGQPYSLQRNVVVLRE